MRSSHASAACSLSWCHPSSTWHGKASGSVRSGEQREDLHVGRTHHAEVAPVEGGDLVGAQALGDGDDGGVGATEAQVGILLDQGRHAADVGDGEIGQVELTGLKAAQELRLGDRATAVATADEMTDLGNDGG